MARTRNKAKKPENKPFKAAFKEAVENISRLEKKELQYIQSDIAADIGVSIHSIDYWRRGYPPADFKQLDALTHTLGTRKGFTDRLHLEKFLKAAGYTYTGALCEVFFPTSPENELALPDNDNSKTLQAFCPLQRPPHVIHFTLRYDKGTLETELDQILRDLQPGHVVTLYGPSGIGKTVLAIEAIWSLAPLDSPPQRFPDGIVFHDFYKEPQADVALEKIARAYGEDPLPTPMAAAQRVLSYRQALLVLDGAENADDLDRVLTIRGSKTAILITTTYKHNIEGVEHIVTTLPADKAKVVFQKWSKQKTIDLTTIENICALVGYLPLALRIAGEYVAQRQLTPSEYLELLHETELPALHLADRKHKSISVLLAKSITPLGQGVRDMLAVIALLALSPFNWEVLAATLKLSKSKTWLQLGELINYSLIERIDNHFQVTHRLIHVYAAQKLDAPSGAVKLLADYYTAFAHERESIGIIGYQELDSAYPHFITILARCKQEENWNEALQLAKAVDPYLQLQGRWTQRLDVLKIGILASRALGNKLEEAEFLGHLGHAYNEQGLVEQAIEQHVQALAISQELRDRQGEGRSLGSLGIAYCDLGQMENAINYFQQGLIISQESKDRKGEAFILSSLGLAYHELGQLEEAITHLNQAVSIYQEVGDRQGEGLTLGNLGGAYNDQGQVEKAIEHYEKTLAISREIGDRRVEGYWLSNLGDIYRTQKQFELAVNYVKQGLNVHQAIGHRRGEGISLRQLATIYGDQKNVAEARKLYEQALVISKEIGDRRNEGYCLNGLGQLAFTEAKNEQARNFYIEALRIGMDTKIMPIALSALTGIAYLYLTEEQKHKALTLVGVVLKHRATDMTEKKRTEMLLLEASKDLSPDKVNSYLEQGKQLTIASVAKEVLANNPDKNTTIY